MKSTKSPRGKDLGSVIVALAGRPTGSLSATPQGYVFTYFADYIGRADAKPVSCVYPLSSESYSYSFAGMLPPFFDHLLPEGWLKELAESAHLPTNTVLEKLATLCRSNLGAVEIYGLLESPPTTSDAAAKEISAMHQEERSPVSLFVQDNKTHSYPVWKHCTFCAELLPSHGYNRNFHDDCSARFFGSTKAPGLVVTAASLVEIAKQQLARRESLTGVQPKFSAIFATKQGALADNTYIVKPEPTIDPAAASVFYQHTAVCEFAAMYFAKHLGLETAATALLYLGDQRPALVSKRFDRQGSLKIHTEDFAQALGIRDKYQGSHEKIAKVLRNNPPGNQRDIDLLRFLQVTILNFVIGNSDAHLKNFSLIHEMIDGEAGYRLAPLYDILPIKMFAKGDSNQLALMIDGKANRLTSINFDKFAIKLGLSLGQIDAFVEKIESNLGHYLEVMGRFGVPAEFVDELKIYCDGQITVLRRE